MSGELNYGSSRVAIRVVKRLAVPAEIEILRGHLPTSVALPLGRFSAMGNPQQKPSGPIGWFLNIVNALRDDPILIIPTVIALAVAMLVSNHFLTLVIQAIAWSEK